MKEITQNDLIKLIEEKQQNATNMFYGTRKDFGKTELKLKKAGCLAEINAYQDLICYLNSVKIVPEEITQKDTELLEPLCNKCSKTNETCPFHRMGSAYEDCNRFEEQQPKVEPLRNDRFREFEQIIEEGRSTKEIVDATSIEFIRFHNNKEHFEVSIWCKCGFVNEKTFIEEPRAKAYYNDLVEWWKYWKQM